MEEDADEEGSGSYERWVAPDAVESTASCAVHVSSDSDPIPLICILFHFLVRMIHSRSTAIHVLELASLHLKLELMTDMFHVLGLFIFKRQFCQTVIICSTSE